MLNPLVTKGNKVVVMPAGRTRRLKLDLTKCEASA